MRDMTDPGNLEAVDGAPRGQPSPPSKEGVGPWFGTWIKIFTMVAIFAVVFAAIIIGIAVTN